MTPAWTFPEPDALDGPTTGDERTLLAGYLAWQRHTLQRICAGLTAEQLVGQAVPTSGLTLLGLVRHLAKVERIWFRERFAGEQLPGLWGDSFTADFDDVDPASAEADVERVRAEWTACDAVLAGLDLDAEYDHRGQVLSLRFTIYHVLHEYARHNGHADLLREAIDGVTGR